MPQATTGYDDRDALFGALREHHLRIGDTQFYVPPTAITVSRRMKNQKVNVLRGRGSFVKSSGHFDLIIDLRLFFTDMNSINNELRPLLAQMKKCPFLPIQNTVLNDVYDIEAVTVSSVSVQTVPGFPYALQASVQLFVFNPYAYVYDADGRTFEGMFNWPLFRWHYRRSLIPDPKRNFVFYEPLQAELHNDFVFRLTAEEDLNLMREWRRNRDKVIKAWMKDKASKGFLNTEDGPGNLAAPLWVVNPDLWAWTQKQNDEVQEKEFNFKIDEIYKDDPGKVLNEYDIHMENWDIPGLILEQVSVGYENIITPMQIQEHESPTHQYLGSQDAVFVAVFKTDDLEALASFEQMIQRTTYLTREYNKEISNGFIQFEHQLARLFGANYMVIEDAVTTTVEGSPGLFQITLTMSSYNRAQRRIAETNWMTDKIKWDIGHMDGFWLNPFDDPNTKQDPLGGFLDLDVRKRAIYDSKVKDTFKNIEVYPDLELPTYREVIDAGFNVQNMNDGLYVDPDFFMMYANPTDYGSTLAKVMTEGPVTASVRDYMGATAQMKEGVLTPDDATQGNIVKTRQERDKSRQVLSPQEAQSVDKQNLTPSQVEVLIRNKALQAGIDQVLVVAMAKAFDPKLRQFYEVGPNANKELGNVEVDASGIPIMLTASMQFYKDMSFLRNAAHVGVMRVSSYFGDSRSLAYNIEYNVEQGVQGLKYYLDQVRSANLVNENVYSCFGISGAGGEREIKKAQWAGALAMYLGYKREYNLLLADNKKLNAGLVTLINGILNGALQMSEWSDKQLAPLVKSLPLADYKKLDLPPVDPVFKDEIIEEADFKDDEAIFKGMLHDTMKYDRRGRLVRAFPTFFLMFVDEGRFVGSVKMADHYFGYRAVTDISYTDSRKGASSTLVLEMCNVFGSLTDAVKANDLTHTSFADIMNSILMPGTAAKELETSRSRNKNWYKSIYLRTGARIHFRMGYGSNPMNMPTLMNGTVTEVQNNGETVSVIVQSDGIELTRKLKASPDDKTRGFLSSKKEPTEIIDELLTDHQGFFKDYWATYVSNSAYAQHSMGIMHFGAPGNPVNYTWRNEFQGRPKNEITMNIYETTGKLHGDSDGFFSKFSDFFGMGGGDEAGINMNLYDKTFWDVLSVCASMGEDFVLATHPFDFRNTIFLGKPYFPIAYGYVVTDEKLATGSEQQFLANGIANHYPSWGKKDGIAMLRKPFRQIHMYDSWTSIIDNSIKTTEDNMYNVALGVYYDEGRMDTTTPIYVDTNIWPEKQKTVQIDTQVNAQGVRLIENVPFVGHLLNKPFKWYFDEMTAIRIAAAGLRDFVKEMYDGYLTVVGDPSVKPYDQLFINDSRIDMSGPAEVREVHHIMNFDVGYITMIKPDACVVNSDKRTTNFWVMSAHAATSAYLTVVLRAILSNKFKYQGNLPIINAMWASTKRITGKMTGRFQSSWMGGKISGMVSKWKTQVGEKVSDWAVNKGIKKPSANFFEVDPLTGEVREYGPLSTETRTRWKKSDLLKELLNNSGDFKLKDAENLFDHIDSALYNRKFLGYHKIDIGKIEKMKPAMSKFMMRGIKGTGAAYRGAKWAGRGIRAILGAGLLAAGPIGWIAFAIETILVEIVTAGIGEMIERFLFTRKACLIAPLRKEGVEFSAGINGHMGSVIGDAPDTWQWLLTDSFGVGPVLMSMLGADTAKYRAMDKSAADDLYTDINAMDADADPLPDPSQDMHLVVSNFIRAHRKPVYVDDEVVSNYENEKKLAMEEMSGRLKSKEEERTRHADYPEEKSSLITKEDIFGNKSGSSYTPDGTSYASMDLNQPSGISAEAIDAVFAGTPLAGLGRQFVQVEKGIPLANSPKGEDTSYQNTSRTISGLYLAAHAAWETGWGKSRIFQDKNNLFGYGAFDQDPYNMAWTFESVQHCINYAAHKIKRDYLTPGGDYYNGPTLQGMNVKYAKDKAWAEGISGIMAKIAAKDPNMQKLSEMPAVSGRGGDLPTVLGGEGKNKYHLSSQTQATQVCINLREQDLQNVRLTLVTPSVSIRETSYDRAEIMGRIYKEKTGQIPNITSTYRENDADWHGTGYAIDIDTPDAGRISGKVRFVKGSKEKNDLRMLIDSAVEAGFSGIIHGDVDVIEEMKAKYPHRAFFQMDDHFNHLHLSYPV